MVKYSKDGSANLGGKYPTSKEAQNYLIEAREAIADLVGASPEEVAFGPNTTSLIFSASRALSRQWKAGDEIVVTELDHRANVDPWLTAAEDKGIEVKWIKLDTNKLELDLQNLNDIINENTKVVAVGHASNGVGTINKIEKIAQWTKEVGAILVVDAVHSAPHILIDMEELQADMIFCSSYKFFGPFMGCAIIKSKLFDSLETYKVISSPIYSPDKLETGTQDHMGLAGIRPTIDFIASLGQGSSRRERVISAFSEIEKHEDLLAEKIRNALNNMPEVTMFQAATRKTPTISFRIDGISPADICEYLSEKHSIFLGDGHFYAQTIGDILGINKAGGWVRAGMAPYNTEKECDRFINAIRELIQINQ